MQPIHVKVNLIAYYIRLSFQSSDYKCNRQTVSMSIKEETGEANTSPH